MFGGLAFLVGGNMAIAARGQGVLLVREVPRNQRHHVEVVVVEVVAPEERVVDAAPGPDAFEDSRVPSEQIDLCLCLAAVLPREDAARRDPGKVELECVGTRGREELVV